MNEPNRTSGKLSAGGGITIVVLLAFLVVAIFYAVHGWNSVAAVGIPPMGWVFLIAGVVVTLLVGGGLMALLFYSSRKGRDI
jgi:flagellar basal body-associated protein FliL